MNPALAQAEELRRRALEEQAGSGEDLQAPVAIPMPETPAAAPADPMPAPRAPLYPEGATAEDLARAYAAKRAADFRAEMSNGAATLARTFGAKVGEDPGAAIRAGGDTGVHEVLARRQLADQDRAAKGKADSDQFSKWLFAKLPVTAKTAAAIGPTGMSQVAGLNPQTLIGENVAYEKAQAAAQAKGAGTGKGDESKALETLLPELAKEYGWTPEKTEAFRSAIAGGLKGTTFRGLAQPSFSFGFNPNTGEQVRRERKSGTAEIVGGGGGSAPVPPGVTPKDAALHRKSLTEFAPPADFEFNDEIKNGAALPGGTSKQKETFDQVQAASAFLDLSKHVNEIMARHPDGVIAGDDATEVEKYYQETMSALRQAQKLGTYKMGEQPMLDKLLANPTSWEAALKNLIGYRDLPIALHAGQDALRQRAASYAQQAGWHPSAYGTQSKRWEGAVFPKTPGAAPALNTDTAIHEPGGGEAPIDVRVPPNAKEVGFRLADGRKVWVPAGRVEEILKHPAFKGAKQEGTQ